MLLVLQGTPWPHAKGGIRNVRGTPAVCLAWHPDKQLLAVAWQDGAVSIWDAARCHLEEDSKSHRHPISQLLWQPDGKHFMTADVHGKVGRRMHFTTCATPILLAATSIRPACWSVMMTIPAAPSSCLVQQDTQPCCHPCVAGFTLGGEQPLAAACGLQPCRERGGNHTRCVVDNSSRHTSSSIRGGVLCTQHPWQCYSYAEVPGQQGDSNCRTGELFVQYETPLSC
jgi:hypothetical protein